MISRNRRQAVFARDGWRCVYCGFKADRDEERAAMTLDHVIPRSKGGTDKKSNLVTACVKCNTKKADMVFTKKSNGKIYRIIVGTQTEKELHDGRD